LLAIVYECPMTGRKVQRWFANDSFTADNESYQTTTCLGFIL
jgi:hypothetical protein